MNTIQEARDHVFDDENFKGKGVYCPCCDQFVRSYQIRIDGVQARALIELVYLYKQEQRFYHVDELKKRITIGNWMAKLKFWGLIEDAVNKDTSKRKSGLWKPTETGLLFVRNMIKLPKYCRFYNMEPLDLNGELVTIIDCLGKKFNYQELMNR